MTTLLATLLAILLTVSLLGHVVGLRETRLLRDANAAMARQLDQVRHQQRKAARRRMDAHNRHQAMARNVWAFPPVQALTAGTDDDVTVEGEIVNEQGVAA